MLKITVDLLSARGEIHDRRLGVMTITNDGTGTCQVGNYDVKIFRWSRASTEWKGGRVEQFSRQRFGPWDLLYLALRNIVGDRHAAREGKRCSCEKRSKRSPR